MDYTIAYIVLQLPEGMEDKEENKIEVEKEIDCSVSYSSGYDGIGPYEYWGFKGYDKGNAYVDIESVTYDKTGLSPDELKAIEAAIEDQKSDIEEACSQDIKAEKEAAAEAVWESRREMRD